MAQTAGAPVVRAGAHPSRARLWPRGLPLALRVPAYRRVWAGIAFLFFARWMEVAAFSWLAVERTSNPFSIAMVGFARIMPFFALGPIGGVLADRFDRRPIQVAARLGMAGLAAIAAALLISDAFHLWHIYAIGVASGVVMSAEVPARRAFTADIVGRHALTSGLAFDQVAVMATLLIGPNIAGVLLPDVSAGLLFVAFAACYAISAFLLPAGRFGRATLGVMKPASLFGSIGDGVRVLKNNHELAGALVVIGVTNLLGFAFFPLIPYFAREVLGAGAGGLGLLISAEAAGGLVAVLLIAFVGTHFKHHGLGVLLFAALCNVTGFGLAFAPTLLGTWALLAMAGGFAAALSMFQANLLVIVTPAEARGRLVGVEMVFGGAYPLGSLLVGALAGTLTPFAAIVVLSALGLVMTGLIAVAVPSLRGPTRTRPVAAAV
ncbi:MAG: MFS transporter [Chloroflexi bacterium]|nr:MFS transporter [Chloroflexota bacterium]